MFVCGFFVDADQALNKTIGGTIYLKIWYEMRREVMNVVEDIRREVDDELRNERNKI